MASPRRLRETKEQTEYEQSIQLEDILNKLETHIQGVRPDQDNLVKEFAELAQARGDLCVPVAEYDEPWEEYSERVGFKNAIDTVHAEILDKKPDSHDAAWQTIVDFHESGGKAAATGLNGALWVSVDGDWRNFGDIVGGRVVCVFDPRAAPPTNPPEGVENPEWVLLLPRLGGNAQNNVAIEVAIQQFGHIRRFAQEHDYKFASLDRFYANPVYTLTESDENALGDAPDILNTISAFEESVYRYRAFCHFAVGNGAEEGWISDINQILKEKLANIGTASSAPEENTAGVENNPFYSKKNHTFYALTEETQNSLQEFADRFTLFTNNDQIGEASATSNPIVFVHANGFTPEHAATLKSLVSWRVETNPCLSNTVVLVADSFDDFGKTKTWASVLATLVENTDSVLFATTEDVGKVIDFFAVPDMDATKALVYNSNAFPRLHFYVISSAGGRAIEDKTCIGAQLTVGPLGSTGLPASTHKKLAIQSTSGDFVTDRLIVAPSGDAVTFVQCVPVLTDIFKSVLAAPEGEADEESSANVQDLISEYEQYLAAE